MMKPEEARDLIQAAILRRPELRYTSLESQDLQRERMRAKLNDLNSYTGFCYIASEAFCALVPEAEAWQLDRAHFWNQIDGVVWDLTVEQFENRYPSGYPYVLGKRTRFKQVSWRAFELIREADPIAAHVLDLSQRTRRTAA